MATIRIHATGEEVTISKLLLYYLKNPLTYINCRCFFNDYHSIRCEENISDDPDEDRQVLREHAIFVDELRSATTIPQPQSESDSE